jgi:hypothetical protein
MLRVAVLAVGLAMLFGASVSLAYDIPGLPLCLLIAGGTITVGTLLERVLYKPLLGVNPGPGWQKTGERFIDPDSGKLVDVFYDPKSGERRYVANPQDVASRGP